MSRFQLPLFKTLSCCSLVCLLIILRSSEITAAGYEFLLNDCPTDANYTADGTYQSELYSLLSSLPSSAAAAATGYYNDTVGRKPNQVYGLAQCRGDESSDDCRSCLDTAAQTIVQKCPRGQSSAIFYDECFLRYSNRSFFSPNSTRGRDKFDIYLCNPQNASDPQAFDDLLGSMMGDLATQASKSLRKYADAVVVGTSSTMIYGLMQCTGDLSQPTCLECLQDLRGNIPKLCGQRKGGRILGFNCYVRYELYQFYRMSAGHPEMPPAPAPMLLPPSPAPAVISSSSAPASVPAKLPSAPPQPAPSTTNVPGAPQGGNTSGVKSSSHRTWVLPRYLIVMAQVAVFAFVSIM